MSEQANAPRVIGSIDEVRRAVAERRAAGASVAFVPTMGALHDGHLALVRRARELADLVVVSIFVNPLQFGAGEDLDRYPRTLDADVAALAGEGVELVFAPAVAEMYPDGPSSTRVVAGEVGALYEGASRPGHFDGALTVVAKLLHYGTPGAGLPPAGEFVSGNGGGLPAYRAYFGHLHHMRERLQRQEAALVLSRALRLLEDRANAREPLDLESAQAMVESQPLVELDYFDVVDPATLEPLAENCRETPFRGEALALIAARVGPVRLIDNAPLRS